MRTRVVLLGLGVFAAACATPSAPRAPLVPPLVLEPTKVVVEPRLRADADRRPSIPSAPSVGADAERDPAPSVYRSFVEIVEVPVEVERPIADGARYDGARYDGAMVGASPVSRARFPVHAAIGVAIAARIHRHHRHFLRGFRWMFRLARRLH